MSSPVAPPQHGGWAFVGLPVVLGWVVGGFSVLTVLLGIGFVLAFPTSYFAIAYLRFPRRERYVKGLLIWGIPAAVIAVVVVLARGWLVWVGLGYLIAFAINLAFAKNHNERSLSNDAVFIAECVAITPIMWAVGQSTSAPNSLWLITAFVALTLLGSTLHVRSLMRKRSDHRYRIASQIFAVASVVIAVALVANLGLAPIIATVIAFGYLAVRAFVVGRRPRKPGIIGMLELVGFVLVAVAACLM